MDEEPLLNRLEADDKVLKRLSGKRVYPKLDAMPSSTWKTKLILNIEAQVNFLAIICLNMYWKDYECIEDFLSLISPFGILPVLVREIDITTIEQYIDKLQKNSIDIPVTTANYVEEEAKQYERPVLVDAERGFPNIFPQSNLIIGVFAKTGYINFATWIILSKQITVLNTWCTSLEEGKFSIPLTIQLGTYASVKECQLRELIYQNIYVVQIEKAAAEKAAAGEDQEDIETETCLLYTSPSPRDRG